MAEYKITWEIDLDASSPKEAARKAMDYMKRPGTTATVFHTWEKEKNQRHDVDLTEGSVLKSKIGTRLFVHISEIDFTPKAALEPWDEIEVSPVCILPDGFVEVCEPEDADFWSVYLHQRRGGVQCIADLPTKELAKAFALLLENAVQTYKK